MSEASEGALTAPGGMPAHLVVEMGPEKGGCLHIPSSGARIGRAPENDITLSDDSLSRYHCCMSFQDGVLTVTDLRSTNETLVNDLPVSETALKTGDKIEVGETLLRVVDPREAVNPAGPPAGSEPEKRPSPLDVSTLLKGLLVLLILFAVVSLFRLIPQAGKGSAEQPSEQQLTVHYEKVEADADTVFRYELDLRDGQLSVRVDDLERDRHVEHQELVDEDVIRSLGASLASTSFFRLRDEYRGPDSTGWNRLDLEIGMGRQVHRSRVINGAEPPEFAEVRWFIEDFAENTLGLAYLSVAPQQLIELARTQTDLGGRLFDERLSENGKLYGALQAFRKAKGYLETIDPKPDFYRSILSGEEESLHVLNQWLEDYAFQAERALKRGDWRRSEKELRAILEQLPEPSDARYKKARRDLLALERRFK